MHIPTAATVLALAGTSLATGGHSFPAARVVNRCSFPVTVWAVGSDISGGFTLSPGGGFYAEQLQRDPKTGGRALKVTRSPDGLFNGSPELIFAYNLDGDKVWYDLSSVFGDALPGNKLVVASAEPSCPSIVWPNGTPPAGSQVKVCTSSKDVTLAMCAP